MNFKYWAGAIVFALAGQVIPEPVWAQEEKATTEAQPKKEKLICRSERVLGSRTRYNRTCLTQAEWDQLAAQSGQELNRMQRNASGSSVDRSAENMGGT